MITTNYYSYNPKLPCYRDDLHHPDEASKKRGRSAPKRSRNSGRTATSPAWGEGDIHHFTPPKLKTSMTNVSLSAFLSPSLTDQVHQIRPGHKSYRKGHVEHFLCKLERGCTPCSKDIYHWTSLRMLGNFSGWRINACGTSSFAILEGMRPCSE